MKPILLITILLFSASITAQTSYPDEYESPEDNIQEDNGYDAEQPVIEQKKYGWNKRIALIVGGGMALVSTKLYETPAVDDFTDFVILEKAKNIRPNFSLGIAYTPYVKNIVRNIQVVENGSITDKPVVEYEPHGITFGLFFNLLSLAIASVSSNTVTKTVDVGFGFGWRLGDITFLVTNEYFLTRQPRDYFVDIYKNNDKMFTGAASDVINTTNNNIFKTKVAVSWGLKIAYTFNTTKWKQSLLR